MFKHSDEFWAKRSQKSLQHFDILYRRHIKKVYGYMRYRLNTNEEAEDVTSQVFMKAIEHIQSYNSTQLFVPWLMTIARNTLIDYWRTKKIIIDLDIVCDQLCTQPDFLSLDTHLRVEQLLKKLKPADRFIVSLRFLEDKTYQEIAALTGKSENSLMVLFHRIKKFLQDDYV